jgi:uncharacterized protein (DUF58 family)
MTYLRDKKQVSRYLDPATVGKLQNMELKARLIVEGYIAGLHRSPYHGFSVEFAEYRPYMQSDSVKAIDWKVFAKTDRTYVKVFEEETNLIANVLLDKSGSMGFPEGGVTKLDYGCMLAASLTYLMNRQQDAVGLCLFDDEVRRLIPHRSVRRQMFQILSTLEGTSPGSKTSISPALHEMAERMSRRGLVILISDLMDNPDNVLLGLKHFRHKGHEVIVFHVLDPRETDIDYKEAVEFEDMETGAKLRVEPQFLRDQFRKDVRAWTDTLERGCRNRAIDYHLLRTDTPFDVALTAYLGKRARMG